jgi:enterochelin esterase-like enzyme
MLKFGVVAVLPLWLAVASFSPVTSLLPQRSEAPAAVVADMAPVEPSQPYVVKKTLWSEALGREMPYQVYLPSGYETNTVERYPVLFMLHGLGGDYSTWEHDGLFARASELIAEGDIPPMIIVTPEGERGYWIDHAYGGPRYGTYLAHDLVGIIDSEYRTLGSREFRAIGGMSMGAHGALQIAMNNPDEFGVVGAHSVALRTKQEAFAFFGDEQYFKAHDPVSLCQKDQATARRMDIWIDIGASDPWIMAASRFHEQLLSTNIPHDWTVLNGGHDDSYWAANMDRYLRFYGESFVNQEVSLGF